jgi:hypothetical protein
VPLTACRPRSAGVCHSRSASIQIGRTCSLAIPAAASAFGPVGVEGNGQPFEKAGNGLHEIAELPSWARHQSFREVGYADSASVDRRRLILPFPLFGGGVGCPIWLCVPQWVGGGGVNAETRQTVTPAQSVSLPDLEIPLEMAVLLDSGLSRFLGRVPRFRGLSLPEHS